MSILSENIQIINAKFGKFSSFVDRVNTHSSISAILLQECWIDDSAIDSLALFNLKDYNMVYQTSRCCRHGETFQRINIPIQWHLDLLYL